MDDYNENIGILIIILIVAGNIMLLLGINYYQLTRFKKCYDNDFKLKYCYKYKDY